MAARVRGVGWPGESMATTPSTTATTPSAVPQADQKLSGMDKAPIPSTAAVAARVKMGEAGGPAAASSASDAGGRSSTSGWSSDRVTDINTTTSHIQQFTGRQQATVEELDRRVTDMIGRIEAMSSVTASAERRTAPRVPITVPGTLRLGPTVYPITVINLSRGGMRCSLGGAQPPPSNATVSIELQLMDTALNLQGTVKSTTPDDEVGIEFIDTSSAAAKSLETYLGSG